MTKKITVLLPDDLFGEFDSFCKSEGFKKSTLIARLVREYLDQRAPPRTAQRPPQA